MTRVMSSVDSILACPGGMVHKVKLCRVAVLRLPSVHGLRALALYFVAPRCKAPASHRPARRLIISTPFSPNARNGTDPALFVETSVRGAASIRR